MKREVVRMLKSNVRLGSTEAAMALLERSILFKHKKLAVLRYLVAERLGAELRKEQFHYCRSAILELSDKEITSVVRQAAELAPRTARVDKGEKTLGEKSAVDGRWL